MKCFGYSLAETDSLAEVGGEAIANANAEKTLGKVWCQFLEVLLRCSVVRSGPPPQKHPLLHVEVLGDRPPTLELSLVFQVTLHVRPKYLAMALVSKSIGNMFPERQVEHVY